MERIEYRTMDRTGWPAGLWDTEPDKVQWQDEATGLPCLAVRNHAGAWCGYIGVPEGHQHFGKCYDLVDADVHGGLTFSDACSPSGSEAKNVCHVPAAGETDHVWWLGFDCIHCYDISPDGARRAQEGGIWALDPRASYRTLGYVQNQCAALAAQLQP